MEKRYYWIRLQDDFFDSLRIKKLRKLAGGDTYTIIYLKMQLKCLIDGGFWYYKGIEDTFAEEVALDIDEDVENVKITIQYLLACGLMEATDDCSYKMPYVMANVGSESASAQRVRDFRKRQKEEKALHCNNDETQVKRLCSVEKEIDIDIDKDIKKESKKKESRNFVPPTLSEVKAYCQERVREGHSAINPEQFIDFYSAKGWMIGKNKVKDWKACVRTWENRRKEEKGGTNNDDILENFDPEKYDPLERYRVSKV